MGKIGWVGGERGDFGCDGGFTVCVDVKQI